MSIAHELTIPSLPLELVGRRLGEFVLREHLGEGGFGLVFRAEQPTLEREAVVKVARAEAAGDAQATQRFLAEARLASRIDHPFAAHVYAFGAEADDLLWIAMELVRGTPLDVLLAEQGPLPLERAIPFLRRLCEVVHTAHEQGIVHRDLKPANVMVVSRAGSVFPKLLDLGIAADLRAPATTVAGVAKPTGTPLYMAPELWLGGRIPIGPPADVYALGAVAYELLTGAPPFLGKSPLEIAAKHARAKPPSLGAAFPAGLDEAIAKALAKQPAQRFPTALAFGEALMQASGVSLDSVNLPQLDELTRDELVMRAPQPIAEAVAALDVARAPAQAREALLQATKTCAQYVALVGLACALRAAGPPTAPATVALLEQVRAEGLDAAGWWKLARELGRPFATIGDAHPMPELIALFFERGASLRTAMEVLLAVADPGPTASADELHAYLVAAIPAAGAMLRSLQFLASYPLVVIDPDRSEHWSGVRRPVRAPIAVRASVERTEAARVIVVDAQGALVADLAPVAQVGAPAPGAPPEVFWLDGPRRQGGARLLALPGRLTRGDLDAWPRLGLRADGDTAARKDGDEAAPYRGLMTFTEADASLFFGREREVEGFVNRLRAMPLVAVVGPSGAGKSSFVRAGVLPALGDTWRSLVARPGATPLTTLCARIDADLGITLTPDRLRADRDALGAALRAHARAQGASLLVVIDQFEELFTLCLDPTEQEVYADALVRAARTDDDAVRVVVTLRDDFLVRAAQLVVFRERLATSLQLLTTPVAADLLRILVEPARRAGYEFEDGKLAEEMVAEVAAQPAALALVSFTAYQLWQYRDRQFRQLTRKAYRALGGVGGALAQHAESTLAAMPSEDQAMVREMFRHLVTAEGTRAVLSRAELLQVSGGVRAETALEQLITGRLLVAMETPGGESIEVVHEALLSAWPRLVRWRQEDAEGARLRDQIRVAARQWHDKGETRGLLWRGEALTEYRLWRARYPGSLTSVEEAFGAASVADAARGRRWRRGLLGAVLLGLVVALVIFARLRSEADANRVVAEASSARAIASESEVRRSLLESQIEQGRRALVEDRTTEALLYLDQALQGGGDTVAVRYLIGRALEPLAPELARLRGHTGQVFAVSLSPDATRAATAADDGSVRVWNATTGEATRTVAVPEGMTFVAWLDDTQLAVAGPDGTVKLLDAATGTPRRELAGNSQPVNQLGVTRDGRHVLVATTAGQVRVWNLASGVGVDLGAETPGSSTVAAFAPDARAVAVGIVEDATGGGSATVWSLTTPPRARTLVGHEAGVVAVAFDPTGRRVVTGSVDGTARIWDAETGRPGAVLRGHDKSIRDAVWNLDGTRVATASVDGTVRIWDPETGTAVQVLRGHTAQVNRVRYLANDRLATVSADGSARVWDPARGQLLAELAHSGYLFAVDVDLTGRRMVSGSWDGTAKVWDLGRQTVHTLPGAPTGTPYVPAPLLAPGELAVRHSDSGLELWSLGTHAVTRVATATVATCRAVTATGERVAVGDAAGTISVVAASGQLRATWTGATAGISALAFAPDGTLLAAGRDRSLVTYRDDGTELARVTLPGVATSLEWARSNAVIVAVSVSDDAPSQAWLLGPDLALRATLPDVSRAVLAPDGSRVAIGHGAELHVRDVHGRELARLPLGSNASDVAWHPSGTELIVGETDGSLERFAAEGAGYTRRARIAAHSSYVLSTTISADGELAATVGADDIVIVWDARTWRPLDRIAAPPGTVAAAFDPTSRYLVTTDDTMLDVRRADRSNITPRDLAELVRCRLPYRLEGQAVVPNDAAGCP